MGSLNMVGDQPLARVFVIGAGIMGTGIAQIAAQAGHDVLLFDVRDGAAQDAKTKLSATLSGLLAKGKMSLEASKSILERIVPSGALSEASTAGLVVEAIVESLDAKRSLFRSLEEVVRDDCILASNTSSISITAISNGLRRPERVVGMHFFNPVPQMKLCEVVTGLQSDDLVAQAVVDLAARWGKSAVRASSTPGFIVNRIARPFYAETLALLQERAVEPAVLDACLRSAGFRMGPCELMDLIGHDTNLAVTTAVYEANYHDKRFVPSLVQRELVDGGLLGRKSGRGFYSYPGGAPAVGAPTRLAPVRNRTVSVHGIGRMADSLAEAVGAARAFGTTQPLRVHDGGWTGLAIGSARLVLTDGRTATEMADAMRRSDIAVFDRPMQGSGAFSGPIAFAFADGASAEWHGEAASWLALLGLQPHEVSDVPGLVVARTIAMLINEAADAVLQGVCSVHDANMAMRLGVNYPAGPFEWLDGWGAHDVVSLLDALDGYYRGERYRVSPWLRRRAGAVR